MLSSKYECIGQIELFDYLSILKKENNKILTEPSENEILEQTVLIGSGFENGKYRIKKFFLNNTNTKDRIAFVKKEYGIGGCGYSLSKNEYGISGYDTIYGKGITVSFKSLKGMNEYLFSWKEVVNCIDKLINNNNYD